MSPDNDDNFYKIRPAARLIHTIGSDLIGDSYAALVELVKNAYDADATKVEIIFEYKTIENKEALFISVNDDGHGMSFDTVINKWLVPATDDKLKRKKSLHKKRFLQGRKGIGRFAASMLGQEMTLCSVDELGEQSTIVIDWRTFNSDKYLEEIELLVEKEQTNRKSGTFIQIIATNEANESKISIWDVKSIDNLINELRKLISPFKEVDKDKFEIELFFINSKIDKFNNTSLEIEPSPIINLYDYRIHGKVSASGQAQLIYENNVLEAKQYESINNHIKLENNAKYCGELIFDFRVFDRDPEGIDNIINKGLIDPVSEKAVGKNKAKNMLNSVYGVNIYKNLFRIRPYGNGGIDWLDLDKKRIQNPSQLISNNQIVGFITIQSEEQSNLQEKSARDGLKEDEYFLGLKIIAQEVLGILEQKRFIFRKKSQKGRKKARTLHGAVSDLFSFSALSNNIESKLKQFNVSEQNIKEITTVLDKEEKEKAGLLEDIQKTIAIYQGQATLGKIVNVLLHEGRKPIQSFKNEVKNVEEYIKYYQKTKDDIVLEELDKSLEGIKFNSKLLASLFKKLDPLARRRNSPKKDFIVHNSISKIYTIFKEKLKSDNIDFILDCDNLTKIYGQEEDLYIALTNLFENSHYWLEILDKNHKEITIEVYSIDNATVIDFRDNGTGLTDEEIETDIIFEPGYTKKLDGTGLGLSIAGEAVERLKGKLTARKSKEGVHFQIEIEN